MNTLLAINNLTHIYFCQSHSSTSRNGWITLYLNHQRPLLTYLAVALTHSLGGFLLNLDYHLRFDDKNYNHKPGVGYKQYGRYLNGIRLPILSHQDDL